MKNNTNNAVAISSKFDSKTVSNDLKKLGQGINAVNKGTAYYIAVLNEIGFTDRKDCQAWLISMVDEWKKCGVYNKKGIFKQKSLSSARSDETCPIYNEACAIYSILQNWSAQNRTSATSATDNGNTDNGNTDNGNTDNDTSTTTASDVLASLTHSLKVLQAMQGNHALSIKALQGTIKALTTEIQ